LDKPLLEDGYFRIKKKDFINLEYKLFNKIQKILIGSNDDYIYFNNKLSEKQPTENGRLYSFFSLNKRIRHLTEYKYSLDIENAVIWFLWLELAPEQKNKYPLIEEYLTKKNVMRKRYADIMGISVSEAKEQIHKAINDGFRKEYNFGTLNPFLSQLKEEGKDMTLDVLHSMSDRFMFMELRETKFREKAKEIIRGMISDVRFMDVHDCIYFDKPLRPEQFNQIKGMFEFDIDYSVE
jgi:hypothetical protein